jgi:integrase
MEKLLTKEQEYRLREVLRGHHLEALVTLAFVTGMRCDELLSLQWQDVDLSKRELRVLNSKTKCDQRVIHCEDWMTELLMQHQLRQTQLEEGLAMPHLGLVFASPLGGFLKPEQLLKEFDALLEQADVPRIRFHDLRKAHWQALCARLRMVKEGPDSTHVE